MANCFSFDPSKRDEKGTLSPQGLHGLPAGPCGPWTLTGIFPSLTHDRLSVCLTILLPYGGLEDLDGGILSKETVLITNLTAFWTPDEFPIIFKKRNTSHYDGMKWHWGYMTQDLGHIIWICVRKAVLPLMGEKHKKTRYLLEYILGQMASPFPPNWTVSADGKTWQ